jgi:hypothetical protein
MEAFPGAVAAVPGALDKPRGNKSVFFKLSSSS